MTRKSSEYITQYCRAIFWRAVRKFGLISSYYTLKDQQKDKIASFNEFPPCEICESNSVKEVLITRDQCRIVKCISCGLQFTRPRIREDTWVEYLRKETPRSIEFTENRLKYGVALSSNVKYVFPNWYKNRMKLENRIIDEIQDHLEIKELHDVGCGVGFLLRAAQARGIRATGNDLNRYACKVMKQKFRLEVMNDVLSNCPIEEDSLDAIVMRDYIEHSYHPLQDLKAAYKFLRLGGVLWIETFHTDCYAFDQLKGDWNMLFWSHLFHFTAKTLKDMVTKAGFDVKSISTGYYQIRLKMVAQKRS